MCVCAQSLSRVQLFATSCTVAHQAPLSMEFSKQESWSGLPCPPPGDLPDPGMEHASLMSPTLAGGSLPLARKPWLMYTYVRLKNQTLQSPLSPLGEYK